MQGIVSDTRTFACPWSQRHPGQGKADVSITLEQDGTLRVNGARVDEAWMLETSGRTDGRVWDHQAASTATKRLDTCLARSGQNVTQSAGGEMTDAACRARGRIWGDSTPALEAMMRVFLSVAALLVLAFLAGLLEWDPVVASSEMPPTARPALLVISGEAGVRGGGTSREVRGSEQGFSGGVAGGMPSKERTTMVFDQAETGGYIEALKILCEIPWEESAVGSGNHDLPRRNAVAGSGRRGTQETPGVADWRRGD